MIATKVVGLTGGIATGKSTVSAMLEELGSVIIDADLIARKIVEPGEKAWKEIIDSFGREFLNQDGTINRQRLGELVFDNSADLEKLNRITHPLIVEEIRLAVAKWRQRKDKPILLVIDAALLIEVKLHLLVEEVWLVKCNREEQIKRLMARNNLSYREALARIDSQMTIEEKEAYAHEVVDNSGSLSNTREQVNELWKRVEK